MVMKRKAQIETGLQLLSRLGKRPSIEGLDKTLFADGPLARETVEISGNVSSGKTLLLTQLLAKCILPPHHNGVTFEGLGVAVLLINTDHHFRISKLVQMMRDIVIKACSRNNVTYSETEIREYVIIPSMNNFTVVHCYDNGQFKLRLEVLDEILTKDPRIGLVALDSISSFYWQERDSGGVWLIDQYLKNILKIIQRYIFQYKIVMIYTRPDDFMSRSSKSIELTDEPTMEQINRRINLRDGEFGVIETARGNTEFSFKIDEKSIAWIVKAAMET